MRVCLMIEGQEDVSWEEWRALAAACERTALEGLFRSDHYLSVEDRRERGSLDAWTTIAGLAAITSRIRLGSLVSPATFRHPSLLAKSVVTADHISGGRVELGLGAGWWEREHAAYGFAFPPTRQRMDILAEQLEIVHRQWEGEEFSFSGEHYRVEDLDARPKPVQRPHPPLIMGGAAGPRSAALAARWADEYNVVFATPDECRERRERLVHACEEAGRDPATLRFSLMTPVVLGRTRRELDRRAARLAERRGLASGQALLDDFGAGAVVGTVEDGVARLGAYAEAGVERVMLQHLLHDDLDVVEELGADVAPAVA
jgi:F420-dependent oxidoreductase-like protein